MIDFDATANAAVNAAFGEPGTYQSVAGGAAYTLIGVFAEPYRKLDQLEDGTVGWTTTFPTLSTQLVNLNAPPAKGDTWIRASNSSKYRVVDSRPDGVGWVFLILMASQ
jgi:hypothetical protein